MDIRDVERLVNEPAPGVETVEKARSLLRSRLYEVVSDTSTDGAFGEAIASLAEQPVRFSRALIIVLRFLGVDGLIPPSNENNRIAQNLVHACEQALPEIAEHLRFREKRQNFEKYEILRGFHSRMCHALSPLTTAPENLDGLIANRNVILQALGNGIVRQYCEPFSASRVRAGVEAVYRQLTRLNPNSADFSADLLECKQAIAEQKAFCDDQFNFLTGIYYRNFLDTATTAVDKFIESVRGRFTASISYRLGKGDSLPKRYPLHEPGRELSVKIPLRNDGPGIAIAVVAEIEADSDDILFDAAKIYLGSVTVGVFSASFDAMVMNRCERFSALITVSWEELGDASRKTIVSAINIDGQRGDINWISLEQDRPYSTDVAKGSAFVGRQDKITALATKLTRDPMESFFLTGQKRIGKTSLAYASLDFAKANRKNGNLESCYLIWGEIAYEDPRKSLAELGQRIFEFMRAGLPNSAEVALPDFTGSLAPIVRLAEVAKKHCSQTRYVIAIDEFDEIHTELYMAGNLADTFFANIRAITTCDNVCVVLIGGENMPFLMSRQGQKLNKFVRVGLDYFSRDTEWEDFVKLVRQPTANAINWTDDAISEIFNVTNGNPYFAKIVCAAVYDNCVRERDSDVTYDEVRRAIASEVPKFDTNSFIHLWQDGIHKLISDREPDILRRCRVLVAIARTARRNMPVNVENIIASKHSLLLSDGEVASVLNDFVKRGILRERDGSYTFVLPIFETWLTEVGMSQLASDAITEELARGVQAAEDAAYVSSDEVAALAGSWPTYQGRELTADRVRSWYEQVEGHRRQRLLFKLLKRIRFVSEVEIREKLRTVHAAMVRPLLGEFIQRRKVDRRSDLLITYVDGQGKSGQYYASRYAEQNSIAAKAIIAPRDFSEGAKAYVSKKGKVSAVVIIDDIVATGKSLGDNLTGFLRRHGSYMRELGAPIVVVSLFATTAGEEKAREKISQIDGLSIDLRYCELLTDAHFAFNSPELWANAAEYEEALSLCRDLGSLIYPDEPLGFGNQGLLVVFPDTCPNNSLPILHSSSRRDAQTPWKPLFPRLVN